MRKEPAFDGTGVHSGFWQRSKSTADVERIREHLRLGKRVILTGHSLGGAVAAVTTLRVLFSDPPLAAELRSRLSCITFGQPLIGDEALAEFVSQRGVAGLFTAIINQGDVVPRSLLMTKEVGEALVSAASASGIFEHASSQAWALASAAGHAYSGPAGEAFVQAARPFLEKAAAFIGNHFFQHVATLDYRPFGNYIILKRDGGVTAQRDSEIVFSLLKSDDFSAQEGLLLKGLQLHYFNAYANFLESLRA